MDSTFGPGLLGHFDFTLLVEHTIFQIAPSLVLIFTLPFYLHKIKSCSPLVRPGWLLWAKATVAVGIAAVQVASVVFWFKSPLNSRVAQAASILYSLGSVGVIAVTYSSHAYFLEPVIFLTSYLNVTLLLDLTTIYTYYHRTGLQPIARLTCFVPALKFVLLILEGISKRSLIIAERRGELDREVTAGLWSRATYLWINPLLLFRFRHIIDNNVLPDIGPEFDSRQLYQKLKVSWEKQDQKTEHALLRALICSMPWPVVFALLPRLFQIAFTWGQPFLLHDMVNFLSTEKTRPEYISAEQEAISLLWATALIFCGKSLSKMWFIHFENRIISCARGALISTIYDKSLRLSGTESEDSVATTLITTDIPGVEGLISLWYELFAVVLEAAFGIAGLTMFVGAASALAIICTAFTTLMSKWLAKWLGHKRDQWEEHTADRVAATSNILAQIKDIKMTGLAPSMGKYLKELRAKEVEMSLQVRRLHCAAFALGSFIDTVTSAIVVAGAMFWTKTLEPTSTARFYAALAMVVMATGPLSICIIKLQNWSSGLASLSRIQRYLTQEELQDPRSIGRISREATRRARNARSARQPELVAYLQGVNVTMDLTGPILRNASIAIKPSEITMIHGSVGCGKSTLLKLLLGEMPLRNGIAALSTRSISFAGQRPWLLNTTIRFNILGRKAYNDTLYTRVTHICDLSIDFQQLPNGDQTLVGSEGCQLSEAQKQRISIARALYEEATLTILDDPFSSLDLDTAAVIRIRLFSDGNATPNGGALVMTTTMKQHLVDADTVFRIQDDGYVVQLAPQQVDDELEELARNHRAGLPPTVETKNSIAPLEPPVVRPTLGDETDNKLEILARKYGSFSMYRYLVGLAGIMATIIWVLFTALASASEKAPYVFGRIWLETHANDDRYYIGYLLLCIAHPIVNTLGALFFFWFVNVPIITKLHNHLVDATLGTKFGFIAAQDAGSILNRFSSDMYVVTRRLPGQIIPTVWRASGILWEICIISAGAPYAERIIPLLGVLIVAVQQSYLQTARHLRALELDKFKSLVRHFMETSAGVEHIRAFRWQEEVRGDFFVMLNVAQRPFYLLCCIQQWVESLIELSCSAAAITVVAFALRFSNKASANAVGLAFLSVIGLTNSASEWVTASMQTEACFGAAARIRAYVEAAPKEKYKDDKEPVSTYWPGEGHLELNCVSAVYGDQDITQYFHINNMTVAIRPGPSGSVGIIGRTGSGKTTVLMSILNLLDYKGTISIDHREIRTVCPDFLRSRITTITQGGLYLRGSVKFNLDPFHPSLRPSTCIVTDTMCESILRRVGLWNIVRARGGLTARMKDMRFSGGQRQLFQFARAILHHQTIGTTIALMDEATSSLDEETESRIIAVTETAFAGCSKIVISHRAAALSSCSAIIRLDGGRAERVR